jgi:hypothetical protein
MKYPRPSEHHTNEAKRKLDSEPQRLRMAGNAGVGLQIW